MFVAVQFVRFFAGFSQANLGGIDSGFQEVVIDDNYAMDKILVVSVEGIIMGAALDGQPESMPSLINHQLRLAASDASVKAVILKVDSPGGEVMASDQIYSLVADFQKKSGKPVVASMGGLAASGGYYVSAPCQWIVAHELTITGSIGVIMYGWNYRNLLDKVGIRPEVFKSGRFKDMLSGAKSQEDIQPEERRMVQSLVNETFARFKEVIRTGRAYAAEKNKGQGRSLVPDWTDYADGRILLGKEALRLGFIDELGTFNDAVNRAKALAGITQANTVRYERPFGLGNLLRWFVKSENPAVRVDLGLEFPKLEAGRLYFLSPALWN